MPMRGIKEVNAMGKKKGKGGVVHWDKSPQVLGKGSGALSSVPAIRGTADVTEVLCHIIDANCKAYYQLGYERGKASASVANVIAVSDSSGEDT